MPIVGDPTLTIEEDMRRLPKEARKFARPKLREVGELIASDARRRASWSDRIPGTIKVQVSFRLDRERVTVTAGGPPAPHARPYEGTRSDPFRHPVHADPNKTRDEWVWVNQAARPFLFPAGLAKSPAAEPLLHQALGEAAAAIGFTG